MQNQSGDEGSVLARPRRRRWRRRQRLAFGATVLGILLCVGGLWLRKRAQTPPPAPPAPSVPSGPPDPPGIILHDSDSPAVYKGVAINAARLEDIHSRDHPSWGVVYEGKKYHIGYHYVILPDGTTEKGRPDRCPGAHARNYNDWLGVCIVGAFDKKRKRWHPQTPTEAQVSALLKLCQDLMTQYRIPPERVLRHSDVNWTDCPGSRFPYQRIHQELIAYAAAHPEIRPLVHRDIPIVRPTPPWEKRKKKNGSR